MAGQNLKIYQLYGWSKLENLPALWPVKLKNLQALWPVKTWKSIDDEQKIQDNFIQMYSLQCTKKKNKQTKISWKKLNFELK